MAPARMASRPVISSGISGDRILDNSYLTGIKFRPNKYGMDTAFLDDDGLRIFCVAHQGPTVVQQRKDLI